MAKAMELTKASEIKPMTNADVIKQKLTVADLARMIETENCRRCKARKLCDEKYPIGVSADFDCSKLLRQWLRMEAKTDGKEND